MMFNKLMKISLSTALIIMLLLLFIPIIRKRYGARWRYFAWFILAVRLLIPLTVS